MHYFYHFSCQKPKKYYEIPKINAYLKKKKKHNIKQTKIEMKYKHSKLSLSVKCIFDIGSKLSTNMNAFYPVPSHEYSEGTGNSI